MWITAAHTKNPDSSLGAETQSKFSIQTCMTKGNGFRQTHSAVLWQRDVFISFVLLKNFPSLLTRLKHSSQSCGVFDPQLTLPLFPGHFKVARVPPWLFQRIYHWLKILPCTWILLLAVFRGRWISRLVQPFPGRISQLERFQRLGVFEHLV